MAAGRKSDRCGGIAAWEVAGEQRRRDVPVVVGSVIALPQEAGERDDAPYAATAKLRADGVRFCVRSAAGSNARNLPDGAAMAVAYGLPPEEGRKAVMRDAARQPDRVPATRGGRVLCTPSRVAQFAVGFTPTRSRASICGCSARWPVFFITSAPSMLTSISTKLSFAGRNASPKARSSDAPAMAA